MPLYEYRCPECGHEMTVLQRRPGTPGPADCESCGAAAELRLSAFAVNHTLQSRIQNLDPAYGHQIDDVMERSSSADPDHYLRKMRSFDEADE